MTDERPSLLGAWRIDPTDRTGLAEYGRVSMRFQPNGQLIYTIHHVDKDGVMLLTYRVEGDEIVSNQPSAPRDERTRYTFLPDGRLALALGGSLCHFIRDDG